MFLEILAADASQSFSPTKFLALLGCIIVIAAALAYVVVTRADHLVTSWLIRPRGTHPAEQELAFAQLFGTQDFVSVDPRRYSFDVARMNEIANTFGYYYIGERGNPRGSTKVTFQRLPGPPPPRIPSAVGTPQPYRF
ncbi:hypothetical protein [Rhodococcus sp. HNM0569]|uniref:hypothetical protein n=1 Tax=Rhodococcus sp. HNM0569 TaxID=2716340 RepID=UPI00146B9607|nr:hypothetical protein [Rhodococcus sp. HNM0569]NLU82026.1 hypothetical protein [Rhodococcus sp. HNM0569]